MTDRMRKKTAYMFGEVTHLLSLGESPWQIANQLQVSAESIWSAALRHGEGHIVDAFNGEMASQQRAAWAASVARKNRMART